MAVRLHQYLRQRSAWGGLAPVRKQRKTPRAKPWGRGAVLSNMRA